MVQYGKRKRRLRGMKYTDRIVSDAKIMLGKPVIKGTRITVELILKKLSEGMTIEELLEAYPHLTKEDILAVLSYSADVISREEIINLHVNQISFFV
jgi:uncharacterized protein (DUF433 family)